MRKLFVSWTININFIRKEVSTVWLSIQRNVKPNWNWLGRCLFNNIIKETNQRSAWLTRVLASIYLIYLFGDVGSGTWVIDSFWIRVTANLSMKFYEKYIEILVGPNASEFSIILHARVLYGMGKVVPVMI